MHSLRPSVALAASVIIYPLGLLGSVSVLSDPLLSADAGAGWGVMVGSILTSILLFVIYLKGETRIAAWHWGKLMILWTGDLLLLRLFFWSSYSHTLNDQALAMILPSLAVLAITWKWLGARERGTAPSAKA